MKQLSEYIKKRSLLKSGEPVGYLEKKTKDDSFVVQKHAAKRLHFDFRIEYNGVLVSWAIPKGLPTKTGEKRLAIHVEDHPLDYQFFEGEIPKGNYGAGQVEVWDRGKYESEQEVGAGLKKGHLDLNLSGERLFGRYTLIRTDQKGEKENWLIFLSKEDSTEKMQILSHATKRSMNSSYKPMLATAVKNPFNDPEWIFEIKWDGYRIIGQNVSGKKHLWTRNGKDLRERFSGISNELFKSDCDVVIDGEIVFLDNKGRSDFQALQNSTNAERIFYCVFDILYWEGYDLQDLPLSDRKKLLKIFTSENKFQKIRFSDFIQEKGMKFYELAKEHNLEGIVAKKSDSPYLQDFRSNYWQKIKNIKMMDAVIAGYTNPGSGRKYFGSLVLGVRESDKLVYIGRVGTGFNDKSLCNLSKLFNEHKTDISPFDKKIPNQSAVTFIKPELVAQIKYNELTSNGLIRQGSFVGLREDIEPNDVGIEREEMHKDSKEPAITNANKLYWPKEKISKGDLISYYKEVGDFIVPYIKDKPLSLNRFPDGIEGQHFYHKNIETHPAFIKTFEISSEDGFNSTNYIIGKDINTILYIANLGSIEINPWASTIKKLEYPDYLVLDLDPEDVEFDAVRETALMLHVLLDEVGLPNYCKTSGASGVHIFVPMGRKYNYDQVKNFAQILAHLGNERLPKITSLARSPSKRQKRVYLDYLQNVKGQTIACAYSVRPVPGAQVSMPLSWAELASNVQPSDFTIYNVPALLKKQGDLLLPILENGIDMETAIKNIGKLN